MVTSHRPESAAGGGQLRFEKALAGRLSVRSESKGRDHTFRVISYFSFLYHVLLKRGQNMDQTLITNNRTGWKFNLESIGVCSLKESLLTVF